ncbi:MAG TPA: hypothetical protein OIM34_09030 [Ruminococcus bromii]|nr:hypothetical protein [Ruminococcus bromii]
MKNPSAKKLSELVETDRRKLDFTERLTDNQRIDNIVKLLQKVADYYGNCKK